MKTFLPLACALALLAGCVHPAETAIPVTGAAHRIAAHKVPVHLRIRVPKHHKRAHYISAATQGMSIAVTGAATLNATVGLTPASPGCSGATAATVCIVTIALAPCATSSPCYTAAVSTYDAVSCSNGTCTIPNGAHELSTESDVAFGVAVGQSNTVKLTLAGIPSHIVVAPASAFGAIGTTGTLHLIGLGPHPVVVEALDADDDVIVGAGAPAFSVQQSGTPPLTIVQPSPASPNRAILTPPQTYTAGDVSLTFTASFPSGDSGCVPYSTCSVTIDADMVEMLAVVNATGGFGNDGLIQLYALGDTQPFEQMQNDTNDPTSIVADPSGDLYVGQQTGNNVLIYPAGSATVTGGVNVAAAPIAALATDASGDVYVAQTVSSVGTVYEFTPASSQPSRTITSGVTDPTGLATDANGRLYVLNVNSLVEYDPGQTTPVVTASGFAIGAAIAVAGGASPSAFVADPATPALWRFAYGATSTTDNAGSAATEPTIVALDASGHVYAGNQSHDTVVEWSATAAYPATPLAAYTNGIALPAALAFDHAGDLFVANAAVNTVEMFPSGSTTPSLTIDSTEGISAPAAIAVVP